jgi:hypothetical protein
MLRTMSSVTPHDRDRVVRRLSALTGAITAGSLALTGGFMALAKHETDQKTAKKAQQKAAAAAALALNAKTSLVADGQDTTPTDPTADPSGSVQVYSTPSTDTTTSSTTTGKATTSSSTKSVAKAPTVKSTAPAPVQQKVTTTTTEAPPPTTTSDPPPPPDPPATKSSSDPPPAQTSGS